MEGQTIALDDDDVWSVGYSIRIDDSWRTRDARIAVRSARGVDVVDLERVESRWFVDGQHAPELDGCEDLDLEASACTRWGGERRSTSSGSAAQARAMSATSR